MPQVQITTLVPSDSISLAQFRLQNVHLSPIALCIVADSESRSTPETVEWRDIFCNDCGNNECLEGTAEQLAARAEALGWAVTDRQRLSVRCPDCGEKWS